MGPPAILPHPDPIVVRLLALLQAGEALRDVLEGSERCKACFDMVDGSRTRWCVDHLVARDLALAMFDGPATDPGLRYAGRVASTIAALLGAVEAHCLALAADGAPAPRPTDGPLLELCMVTRALGRVLPQGGRCPRPSR